MPEIKTRDRSKEIKTLDKSALVGQRMKGAFIRTKEKEVRQQGREDATPSEYAEGKIQRAIDEEGQLGAYSTRLAVQRGRQAFQKQRAKKAAEASRQDRAPESEESFTAGGQPITSEQSVQPVANSRTFEQAVSGTSEMKPPMAVPVERGGELTRQQAVKRMEQARRVRNQEVVAREDGTGIADMPEKSVPLIRQRSAGLPSSPSVDKAPGRVSNRAIKTSQHTARTVIKTPQAAEAQRQKITQASARTAQIAARTVGSPAKPVTRTAKTVARSMAEAVRGMSLAAKASLTALLSGGWVVVLMVVVVVLFGGVLALFGDNAEGNAYTPVSAEVDAYTPLIQVYAEKHGIPDYVDLIKAIMMTESGGKGSDPMQASESGYNTKYPHKPGAIKDPEYSIDVGVQTIAASLKQAKVESPLDLERIKLALQGYNFGNGYISWALEKYGGYSESNAIEFSQMMAKRLGWKSYGSTKYVSVVLQYYPFGYKFPTGDGDYIWPLPGYTRISSPFGYRNCPYHGRELHGGVDLPAPYGTNILASESGTVVLSTYGASFGNHVAISHPDGSRTMYCHMSARLVSVGDTVVQGQVIGRVGSTGNSTGNHLHFEVWTNGSSSSRVNPMDYF